MNSNSMTFQLIQLFDGDIDTINLSYNEIISFPFDKYSIAPDGDSIFMIHIKSDVKCVIGSELFNKDVYGYILFTKVKYPCNIAKKYEICSIEYSDLPELIGYVIDDIKMDINLTDSMVDETTMSDIEVENYYDYFEKNGACIY